MSVHQFVTVRRWRAGSVGPDGCRLFFFFAASYNAS